jgi:hypothetical protein
MGRVAGEDKGSSASISVMGDFNQVAVRILAEEVIRPVETHPRPLYDLNIFLPQVPEGLFETVYFQGNVAHGPGYGFLIDHEMKLTVGAYLEPVARKVEGRAGNGLQTQKGPVEPLALLQIPHHDSDMVVFLDLNHVKPPFKGIGFVKT